MSVIPLTIFFSLLLAGLFITLFAHEQRRRRFASAERDSLLPLADEQANEVNPVTPEVAETSETGSAHEDHHHEDRACGCLDGSRPPCAGCRRRHAT